MENKENNRTSENAKIIKQITELLKGRTYSEIKGILDASLIKMENNFRLQ